MKIVKENINDKGDRTSFKRNSDVKRSLGLGTARNWRITYYHESNRIGDLDEFWGTIEEAKLHAAKTLLSDYDKASVRNVRMRSDQYWATFLFFNPDLEWAGKTGNWEEIFEERLKLRDIDIIKLRFNNKLVYND